MSKLVIVILCVLVLILLLLLGRYLFVNYEGFSSGPPRYVTRGSRWWKGPYFKEYYNYDSFWPFFTEMDWYSPYDYNPHLAKDGFPEMSEKQCYTDCLADPACKSYEYDLSSHVANCWHKKS